MKKIIGAIAIAMILRVIGFSQPADSLIIGIWLGEYEGYDPQTHSNITVRRRLIIEEKDNMYYDTLWGQPSQSDEIIFEMEIGTWAVNFTFDSVIWTPIISKHIDIANPDSLVEYEHGVHRKELNEVKDQWQFHDDNMNVDYWMLKEEFIYPPPKPAGNTSPVIYENYVYTTSGTVSNLGHMLEYSFNWGDGTNSAWSVSKTSTHTWTTTGVKYVTVTARCQDHTDRMATSESLSVDVQDITETISKPGTPEGETEPLINETYTYTTTGATSDLGHVVQYSFDWGDGSESEWSTSNTAMHSWPASGLKNISVTARCEVHQNKVNTSDNLEVNVQNNPTGINNGSLDEFSFRILNNSNTRSGSPVIISYCVPARSYVSISVYNMQGQLVRSLVSSHHDNGKYETEWNGKDDNGNSAGSGVYFYIFSAKDYYSVQKGVLAE
jgi:hypothetical protein